MEEPIMFTELLTHLESHDTPLRVPRSGPVWDDEERYLDLRLSTGGNRVGRNRSTYSNAVASTGRGWELHQARRTAPPQLRRARPSIVDGRARSRRRRRPGRKPATAAATSGLNLISEKGRPPGLAANAGRLDKAGAPGVG
jgi:hypothetical protein